MAVHNNGYLFLSSYLTQEECFQRNLFGHSKRQLKIVEKIKKGSPIFLFNTDSKELVGIFSATSDGALNIEPDAWTTVYPFGFPSQVRVEWKELHTIRNASTAFPFLKIHYHYELTAEQTQDLLHGLEQAPLFTSDSAEKEKFQIESQAERKFAELLDDRGIAYIRFSQIPGDFSRVLKEMKAKRPDFLVFAEKPYFIEVKPWLFQINKRDITISSEEIEKLKQLELATRIQVSITFPIDPHGLEWRTVDPGWAWAKGERKSDGEIEVLTIPIKELERRKLPFL